MDGMDIYRDASAEDNRREEVRLTTALPTLELAGRRLALFDFSASGFRAALPESFREIGQTGEAVLHIQAAGYSIRKRVSFHVLHVEDNAVGVRYDTLDTFSESSAALF